jgi:hypothetical protein
MQALQANVGLATMLDDKLKKTLFALDHPNETDNRKFIDSCDQLGNVQEDIDDC